MVRSVGLCLLTLAASTIYIRSLYCITTNAMLQALQEHTKDFTQEQKDAFIKKLFADIDATHTGKGKRKAKRTTTQA